MEKYYNEKGQVGVIISPKFGVGWSTWNDNNEALIFDKTLVEALLNKDYDEVERITETIYPDCCLTSFESLEVVFLEPGTMFRIDEYDGSEQVVIYNPEDYFVA